jgi:hypothetical protein
MHVAVEALDVGVADADLEAVDREMRQRATSSLFAGVRDIRLRLRRVKDALVCVAVVGFAGGGLVTSTATSDTPLTAMVGALDGLPERMDRMHRAETIPTSLDHASVRAMVDRYSALAIGRERRR